MIVHTGQLTDDDASSFPKEKLYYGNIPHGKKIKMWGVSRNNVAEVVAKNALLANIRCTIPPISIALWIKQSMIMVNKFLQQIEDLQGKGIPYTSIGIRFFEENKNGMSRIKLEKRG